MKDKEEEFMLIERSSKSEVPVQEMLAVFIRDSINDILNDKKTEFASNNIPPNVLYRVMIDMGFIDEMVDFRRVGLDIEFKVKHWILGTFAVAVPIASACKAGFYLRKMERHGF